MEEQRATESIRDGAIPGNRAGTKDRGNPGGQCRPRRIRTRRRPRSSRARVTITEASVRAQFARQLHRTAIEEGAAKEDQVSAFFANPGEFVAITQSGSYVRLAPRSAVLEGLVQQLLVSSLANGA
jgi:hypothetical protein